MIIYVLTGLDTEGIGLGSITAFEDRDEAINTMLQWIGDDLLTCGYDCGDRSAHAIHMALEEAGGFANNEYAYLEPGNVRYDISEVEVC